MMGLIRLMRSTLLMAPLVLALVLPHAAYAGSPGKILVIKSDALPQYAAPIERFGSETERGVEVIDIRGSKERGRKLIKKAQASGKIAGVFALGTQAAYLAKTLMPGTPMTFAMVLNHERYDLAPPAGGVSVEIPVAALLTRIKLALPDVSRLGLIRSDRITDSAVADARRAASALGVELVVEDVRYSDDVAGAYRRIKSRVDALWMPADPVVVTRSNFRYLSERTRKDNIAFVAFSENFVKAGALLSVSPDYATMGSQAAVMLDRLIEEPGSAQPVQPPLGSSLVVNSEVARDIGFDIGPALRMMADRIIEE